MDELKRDKHIRKSIVPTKMGGDGRFKALALLGDRLLDIILYENLLKANYTDEGLMTQHRSMCVANRNLAQCAEQLLTPVLLSKKEFNTLSLHEKGTVLEAFIGVVYERADFQMTPLVKRYITDIVDLLRVSILGEANEPKSEYKAESSFKKAKSVLLELLQKRGVQNGISHFSIRSYGGGMNLPPFKAHFGPSVHFGHFGLPDIGLIGGDICETKKEAEESCSLKVLAFFQNAEKKKTAEQSSDSAILSDTSLVTADNISSEVVRSRAPLQISLEEGEVLDNDCSAKEYFRRIEGEKLAQEIRQLKEAGALKRKSKSALFHNRVKDKKGSKKMRKEYSTDNSDPRPLSSQLPPLPPGPPPTLVPPTPFYPLIRSPSS